MKKRAMIIILLSVLLFPNLFLIKSQEISTIATVNVNQIYNLLINIDILDEKVIAGKNLDVFIELEKTDLTNISEEILVNLDYKIIKGKRLIEGGFLQTINITNKKEKIINIPTSLDLSGGYILKIIASNPQSYSAEDSGGFWVRKKSMGGFSFHWIFWIKDKKYY